VKQDRETRLMEHRPVLFVVGGTALIGALTAVLMGLGVAPAVNTFVVINASAQSLMSVLLPLSGIMLVRRCVATKDCPNLRWALTIAAGYAILVAVTAVGVSAVITTTVPNATARWLHVPAAILGSLLVQLIAQSVGTAFGLLIRRVVVAFVASIVLPLGLWFVLGAIPAMAPLQAWITPYAAAVRLLSGQADPLGWIQWLVMASVWTLGLNVVAITRLGGPAREPVKNAPPR
jgi:hypothetical protein